MSDYIGQQTTMDKVVPFVCLIVLIAFIACIPSMVADKNKREDKAWHDHGCEMYDDYKPSNVPAKCSAYFVDHYQSQSLRLQPPEEQ